MAEILKAPGTYPVFMTGYSTVPKRGKYTLDLNDTFKFPDMDNIPIMPPDPGESWYILTEIKSNESILPPTFIVLDKAVPNYWVVAFHTPNPSRDAEKCKVGSMLCIKDGIATRFADGRVGYRIEDPSTVLVLPCSMAKLRELNASLRKRADDGLLLKCVVCDNGPVKKCCTQCKTRYCSRECQKQDWRTSHKPVCDVLKTLHQWNRTDWG